MFLWIVLLIVIVFFPWKNQDGMTQEGMTHAEIKEKMNSNYSKITRYLDAANNMVSKLSDKIIE